ncbi:CATRA conflict system CASPASE/TPR repeat-associated protein [Saccharothrix deserti]|uniref:CATRA conflict system CASPASE/TPR repeat-associated protein n=1 Tax=Saccharothrix deserti TaxID=2593674 RepID=UPI00131DDFA0|nr:CATRA conflict system CASPASE/TPR repeat-associated protein [Saccharothrix deserti]
MSDAPTDQELVGHLFAPLADPPDPVVEAGLRAIWARCRDLGAVHPIAATGLPADLPENLRSARPDQAVAALENGTADVQVVLRQSHDVLNLSLVLAVPGDTRARRLRGGSAVPPGWVEFDRIWREVVGRDADGWLGAVRAFQGKLSQGMPSQGELSQGELSQGEHRPAVDHAVLAALPDGLGDRVRWLASESPAAHLSVWDPEGDHGTDRALVVLAPADRDRELSAWTWSRGTAEMPPLARYLMHAAKLRYSVEVWRRDLASLERLRTAVDDQVDRARADPVAAGGLHRGQVDIAAAMSALRRLRQVSEIARTNMAAVLDEPLHGDRGLAEWFDRQLDHTLTQLAESSRLAQEVRELTPAVTRVGTTRRGTPPNRRARRPIRMGFMLDIVGYGGRDSPAKESLQERLATVVRLVLTDMGVALSETERQGTGDGVLVFLPEGLDVQRALPVLLRSTAERLAHDNRVFQDRMRVRMAADVGPVGLAELGFGGATVTNTGRLLDSKPLRRWVADNPDRDLAVALSDPLHSFVVAEGVPGLPREQFTRVTVRAKELVTTAWLWTG